MSYIMEVVDDYADHTSRPEVGEGPRPGCKSTGRTKSEIAREALRRQVAVARFRELRRKTLPFAEAQGLVTDEDVFRILS